MVIRLDMEIFCFSDRTICKGRSTVWPHCYWCRCVT